MMQAAPPPKVDLRPMLQAALPSQEDLRPMMQAAPLPQVILCPHPLEALRSPPQAHSQPELRELRMREAGVAWTWVDGWECEREAPSSHVLATQGHVFETALVEGTSSWPAPAPCVPPVYQRTYHPPAPWQST